jgi:hypothetical protein
MMIGTMILDSTSENISMIGFPLISSIDFAHDPGRKNTYMKHHSKLIPFA